MSGLITTNQREIIEAQSDVTLRPEPLTSHNGRLNINVGNTITPWTPFQFAALSTSVQTVKGTAGTFGGYMMYNPNGTVVYLQVFDVAGSVTLGATVPAFFMGIPASAGANIEMADGITMANAIKIACTTTATGSGAPVTGLDASILYS